MLSREEITAQIEEYMRGLEFPSTPSNLYEPITYTLEEGGKRLRPMLFALIYSLYSDDLAKAMPCAGAIEVFHNFTLLHDDIMDNAEVRRGKPTVHVKWGANTAILSGDAMVIYAYSLLGKLSGESLEPVFKEFNKMAMQVCEGQQYDMDFERREEVSLDDYQEMIRLKTAVIFASAAKMAAMLAGAPETDIKHLYDFGIQLGMAFQLQDDYLDTYGTASILGKEIGGDIAESKKTFLTITALQESGAATKRALLSTFSDDSHPLAQRINRVRTIYNSLDIPAITRGIIEEHLAKATVCVDALSVGAEQKDRLLSLITALQDRNK